MAGRVLLLAAALGLLAPLSAARGRETPPPSPGGRSVEAEAIDRFPDWAFRPGQLVDVGGHSLNLYCMGSGAPTVLLSSGWGWGAAAFAGIMPAIAQRTRVCAYDRAARGFSDPGPERPAVGAEVKDLHAALARAAIPGPYVFAGWSAGGMEGRRYAWTYPREVVGLVTIDGAVTDFEPPARTLSWLPKVIAQYRECEAAARARTLDADERLLRTCAHRLNPLDDDLRSRAGLGDRVKAPEAYAAIAGSLEAAPASDEAVRVLRRPFGAIPVVVLVAGDNVVRPGSAQTAQGGAIADGEFLQASFAVAALSTAGVLVVAPHTTHAIQLGRPELVTRSILSVVERVRADPHPPTVAP